MRDLINRFPMNAYSTHLTPSITCAIRSGILWPDSPIMELGCGHYSTPILASIAKIQKRKFTVITSDKKWAKSFSDLPCEIKLIDFNAWPKALDDEKDLGVVLVDNEEFTYGRYLHLYNLSKKAKVVLFHDANEIDELDISWGPLQSLYEHIYIYDRYYPSTAILSREIDPQKWFI